MVHYFEGEVSFVATKFERIELFAVLAEALGTEWRLLLKKKQNLNRVIIESDDEEVVNCINGSSKFAAIDLIVLECEELFSQLESGC
jgi:hypothetical protein